MKKLCKLFLFDEPFLSDSVHLKTREKSFLTVRLITVEILLQITFFLVAFFVDVLVDVTFTGPVERLFR